MRTVEDLHAQARAVSDMDRLRMKSLVREDFGNRVARAIPWHGYGVLALLRAHDQPTSEHGFGLGARNRVIGDVLGFGHTDVGLAFVLAGIFHDVGKIAVPREVLRKPETLTADERRQVRIHPTLSFKLVRGLSTLLARSARILVQHHEHGDVDDRYPRDEVRWGDPEILVQGKLISAADKLDAWLEDRYYRGAIPANEAIRRVLAVHRDPRLEDVLVSAACVRPRNAAFAF